MNLLLGKRYSSSFWRKDGSKPPRGYRVFLAHHQAGPLKFLCDEEPDVCVGGGRCMEHLEVLERTLGELKGHVGPL